MAEHHSLAALRQQIDTLDTEILSILQRRLALSSQVAEAKKDIPGTHFFQPVREHAIIEHLVASGALTSNVIAAIWLEIFSASRALQDTRPVAIPCAPGEALHLAAILALGRQIRPLHCTTVDEVRDLLLEGRCSLGVLPEGTVVHEDLHVVTETYVLDRGGRTGAGCGPSILLVRARDTRQRHTD